MIQPTPEQVSIAICILCILLEIIISYKVEYLSKQESPPYILHTWGLIIKIVLHSVFIITFIFTET